MSMGFDDSGAGAEGETTAPAGSEACGYTSYEAGEVDAEYPKTGEGTDGIAREVWDALYEVQDPEMPVSVVDLGLIYDVFVDEAAHSVVVEMTLTYTGCPARDMIMNDVRCAAETASGVDSAEVKLRYSPGWNVNMVTEQGRADLREFGLSV
jgi:metal-sulfur cluster biosynthetic enzyme